MKGLLFINVFLFLNSLLHSQTSDDYMKMGNEKAKKGDYNVYKY